jgi:hypothetical protein
MLLLGVLVTKLSFIESEGSNGQFNLSELNLKEKDESIDFDIKKLGKPAYYTVFKLILNFLPLKDVN